MRDSSTTLNYPSTYAFNPAKWYADQGAPMPAGVLSGVDSANSPMRPTLASAGASASSVAPLVVLVLIVYLLQKRLVRLRASGGVG